ncbi:uncharacterized protein LOC125842977 [Solanum stenotomum]|uniref:uncharacterized protein LOC125842977 n=1 Tax=Solanum stenotomum TaxID=172797 RepID=UPI0020D0B013|nr:uncharacterized protein LOC125842977 [Solanum stenotomum]
MVCIFKCSDGQSLRPGTKDPYFVKQLIAEVVKELVKVRADFAWKKDELMNGCSPLHIACSKGHLDITRELLKLDMDLSGLQDNEGKTPLHWAVIKGRVNIIAEILSVSLESSEMTTKHGETILHLAVKNNHFEVLKFLMESLDVSNLMNFQDTDGNTILHLATVRKLTTVSFLYSSHFILCEGVLIERIEFKKDFVTFLWLYVMFEFAVKTQKLNIDESFIKNSMAYLSLFP